MSRDAELAHFLITLAKKDTEIRELREIVENCCRPAMTRLVELEKEKDKLADDFNWEHDKRIDYQERLEKVCKLLKEALLILLEKK